jgi:hypothetical protein
LRAPAPDLLDLLYRACAFPIDDLDVQDAVRHTSPVIASTWYVPTATIPAILFVMGNGSGNLAAITHELHRLATLPPLLSKVLPATATGAPAFCYHYFFHLNHIDSRLHSRSIEGWDPALDALLHTAPLHPWYQPLEQYGHIYAVGRLDAANLPSSTLDADDDFIGDPDAPVARRIGSALPDLEELTEDELLALDLGDTP